MDFPAHIKPYLEEIEALMEADLKREDERVYGMLVPFVKRGGKRIRPALMLLACGAVGGDRKAVVEPAEIIELFHNFTLIHDDVEDDSQFRRGEPTLHITYGIPIALNSGDALFNLIWRKLVSLHLPASKLVKLERLYAAAFKRVVDGQGIELSWIKNGRFDVSEAEYLEMSGGKTSALLGLACEGGAMCASGGKRLMKRMREYGEKMGIAFQIQDDILNLTGDFGKYQKEIGGDISEGKRTLMVVHCLAKAGEEDRKKLIAILASHSKNKEDIDAAIAILKGAGSVEYARRRALRLVSEAKEALSVLPDSPDKTALLSMADYVVQREQ